MARLKEMAVARGGDTFLFDPDEILEIPGYNVRDMESPETQAHIRSMADSIHAGGTAGFPPITIGQENGKIFVYAGYCRRRAFSLAKNEGAPVKGILAIANTQNAEERTLDLLASNNGLPLTQMEKAQAVKRLLSFSWTPAEIAKRLGVSQTAIGNLITLIDAPKEVQQMVAAGEVSASMAIGEVRKDKTNAASVLAGAVEKAKGEGKAKATAKHVREKRTVAGLALHKVPGDRFELDEVPVNGMDFPCGWCAHRHGTDKDEPCCSCGHNMNADVSEVV